jgi:SAM-dependent methyltransferase
MFGALKRHLVRRPAQEPIADRTALLHDGSGGGDVNESYWTDHNVTLHAQFTDAEASLTYFDWRNGQYFNYIELMPVSGQDDKVVLDYGCGPGNDLVGFGHYSRPLRLIGADISTSSLREAQARLALHDVRADLVHIREDQKQLPLADASIDYIHSSGVVHHARDPQNVLREFRRIVKPGGSCRIMVYNYDSLWLHLYVAYVKQIKEGLYPGLSVQEAFARLTDGENCPISRAYPPREFIALCQSAGFQCRFLGAAISMWEMTLFPLRFEAIMQPGFAGEHRRFLMELELDSKGFPRYRGHYAGVDGCYELVPA